MPGPDATPRFQWRHREDDGWTWSSSHTIEGACSGCCPRDALRACPSCGGRLHREPAILDNGLGEALFCQQERTDGAGRPTRIRSAESEAQLVARLEAVRRERRERVDRWIGRAVGGVLAAKLVFAALFLAAIAAGVLANL